jgi:hypothetical protein
MLVSSISLSPSMTGSNEIAKALDFNFGGPNGFSFEFPDIGIEGPQGEKGEGVQFGNLIVIVDTNDSFNQAEDNAVLSSDFTICVDGNHQTPDTFQGSESGTNIRIGFGSYEVNEEIPNDPNLQAHLKTTFTEDCSGVIHPNETKTCTITNTITP